MDNKDRYIMRLERKVRALEHELEEVYALLDIEHNSLQDLEYEEDVQRLMDMLCVPKKEED